MESNILNISEFYKNKNIFITGGAGFLGKVLIEKLLRSIPNIGNIYMLLRPKKGKNITERIEIMLQDTFFTKLRESNETQLKKIIAVAGDCAQLNLGLTAEDYNILTSKINIIFHMAASVRFDDSLQKAVLLNTRGTREIIYLANKCSNILSFIHISTSYCNCIVGKEIDEILYPPFGDWQKFISIAEHFSPEELSCLTQKLIGDHPNTYTFTKALAEHVVVDLCKNKFPTVICRPSIVINTISEPVKGWTDNFNGPNGIMVACGKGLNRCVYLDEDFYSDYIPVDIVVKSLIVAAWDTGLKKDSSTIEILNCCSGKDNKTIAINNLIETCRHLAPEYPFNNILWVPKGGISNSKLYSYICVLFFHLLPAMFFDFILYVIGKKPVITRLQTKIYTAIFTLRYFMREWDFVNDNFLKLHFKILEEDKEVWGFDARHADVKEFIINAILGARSYLLKEPEDTIPEARKIYKKMYYLDKITMTLLYSFFIYIIYILNVHGILFNYINNKLYFYVKTYFM